MQPRIASFRSVSLSVHQSCQNANGMCLSPRVCIIQLLIGSVIFAASASAVMMFAEGLRSASSMGSVLNDRITVSIMFGVGSVLSSLGTIYVQSPVQKRSNALLNAYILVNTINAVIIGAGNHNPTQQPNTPHSASSFLLTCVEVCLLCVSVGFKLRWNECAAARLVYCGYYCLRIGYRIGVTHS